jgi:tight adherence protein B
MFGIAIFLGIVGAHKHIRQKDDFLNKRMKGKTLNSKTNKFEQLFEEENEKELTYKEKIEKDITMSGLDIHFQEYIYMIIGSVFVLFTISLIIFHGRMIPSIVTSSLGVMLPKLYLKRRYKKRLKKFNSQLVDTLRTLTSSLRGGLSIEQAIYNVAETSLSPTKEEFEKVAIDLNYGKGFNESMQALQQRINDSDMDLITTVIFIQKDIGGNLTENLDIIADTIEERIKLKNDLKALTANGRLSALIIGNVPLGLFVLLNLVDASYFDSFFSNSLGMALFGLAIFLDIIGVLVSMKLATPEINEI